MIGRMLRWRLILGAVFIAGLAGLCWLDWRAARPGLWLLPLAVLAAMLAAGELLAMFRKRGHEPLAWVVYGGTLLTVLAASAPGLWPRVVAESPLQGVGWIAVGLAVSMLVAFIGEFIRFGGMRRSTVELGLAEFAITYVGGLIGFLVQVRLFGDGRLGMFALVSLIAIVKSSDIGQYTAGRLFGKHKLAPTVSPGKTWEGVAGGAVFAATAAWALSKWVAPAMFAGVVPLASSSLLALLSYSICLMAAGIIGDLAESLLKRDAGVKDSSSWLPGFGGVLDLLDSLLVAAPVAYLFWALGWASP